MKTQLIVIPDRQESPTGKQIVWQHPIKGELRNPAYLHGELEKIAGFDIVYHAPTTENPVVKLPRKVRGEMKVTVLINHGEGNSFHEAILVWYAVGKEYKMFRGFIVLPTDEKAYKYAKSKQKELTKWI
jgi:hypothetical protein